MVAKGKYDFFIRNRKKKIKALCEVIRVLMSVSINLFLHFFNRKELLKTRLIIAVAFENTRDKRLKLPRTLIFV